MDAFRVQGAGERRGEAARAWLATAESARVFNQELGTMIGLRRSAVRRGEVITHERVALEFEPSGPVLTAQRGEAIVRTEPAAPPERAQPKRDDGERQAGREVEPAERQSRPTADALLVTERGVVELRRQLEPRLRQVDRLLERPKEAAIGPDRAAAAEPAAAELDRHV